METNKIDKMGGMGRRRFLEGVGATALLTASGYASPCATVGTVKFLAFSDIHYRFSPRPKEQTVANLEKIIARAQRANVDFVVQLGDYAEKPTEDADFIAMLGKFGRPCHTVFGNHEWDNTPYDQVLAAFGMKSPHHSFEVKGWKFIACDPNYFKEADGCHHYSNGNHRTRSKDALMSYMPEEQIEWLKGEIAAASGPVVIMSHQSFDRDRGSVPNCAAVRQVIDEANARTPGKVRLVMNGHHHCNYLSFRRGVPYFELNSASYNWLGWKFSHACYSEGFVKKYPSTGHTIVYEGPLSSVVTLGMDGTLRIEGDRCGFFENVTPEMAKVPPDDMGRIVTAEVSSFAGRLDYGVCQGNKEV